MKLEYKDLPNYIQNKDGSFEIYNYTRMLIPIPETKKEMEALEE